MARTAYVCLTDGAYQAVNDFSGVLETLVENYQDGGNYRDLFSTPTDQGYNVIYQDGMFYPADGTPFEVNNVRAPTAAKISDEIEHEPPRAESRKHTRDAARGGSCSI